MSGSTSTPGVLGAFRHKARLSDRVAEDILNTIVARGLKPGDALPPERELGEQFGVSRTVIREAIRALDARGLLEVRVGSRIRVALVDPQTVRDAVQHFVRTSPVDAVSLGAISEALDVVAARAAAEHASEPEIDELRRELSAAQTGQRDDAAAGFRQALLAASHNELLLALSEAVAGLAHPPSTHRSPEQLRAVLSSIASRDPDGAERAIRGKIEEPGSSDTAGR